MLKHKDNLTDLVEQLPTVETTPVKEGSEEQQVVNTAGEVVTLGQEGRPASTNNIHRSSLELSSVFDAMRAAFKKALERES